MFRTRRLKVGQPHKRVGVFVRHAAGTLELSVAGPLTITVIHPMPKGTSGKRTKEER